MSETSEGYVPDEDTFKQLEEEYRAQQEAKEQRKQQAIEEVRG